MVVLLLISYRMTTLKTIDLYPHIVLVDGSADAIVYNFRGVDLTTADKATFNLGGITQSGNLGLHSRFD